MPELAEGIVRVANANMERAIRVVSVERGHDPRRFALRRVRRRRRHARVRDRARLEIGTVLVPRHAGVLSALGMLVADVTRDYSASVLQSGGDHADRAISSARLQPLVRQRRPRARPPRASRRRAASIERQVDVRYVGQSYEITVPFGAGLSARSSTANMQRLYGYSDPTRAAEVVAVRVSAAGVTEKPVLPFERVRRAVTAEARAAIEPGRFDGARASRSRSIAGPISPRRRGARVRPSSPAARPPPSFRRASASNRRFRQRRREVRLRQGYGGRG